MPRFDLRQDDGTLHPLAPFKVLAVMCHPIDRIRREKMLGTIEKETGVARPRRRAGARLKRSCRKFDLPHDERPWLAVFC